MNITSVDTRTDPLLSMGGSCGWFSSSDLGYIRQIALVKDGAVRAS